MVLGSEGEDGGVPGRGQEGVEEGGDGKEAVAAIG
jgi:hypothetical protein